MNSPNITSVSYTHLDVYKRQVYSRPAAIDQIGADFDAPGHIDVALLERIGVSQGSDFYLCGPTSFLQNMRDGLRTWGVLTGNVHTEIFGSFEAITPGMAQVVHTPHLPQGCLLYTSRCV